MVTVQHILVQVTGFTACDGGLLENDLANIVPHHAFPSTSISCLVCEKEHPYAGMIGCGSRCAKETSVFLHVARPGAAIDLAAARTYRGMSSLVSIHVLRV
jgi:hypothetical protein